MVMVTRRVRYVRDGGTEGGEGGKRGREGGREGREREREWDMER